MLLAFSGWRPRCYNVHEPPRPTDKQKSYLAQDVSSAKVDKKSDLGCLNPPADTFWVCVECRGVTGLCLCAW